MRVRNIKKILYVKMMVMDSEGEEEEEFFLDFNVLELDCFIFVGVGFLIVIVKELLNK